MDSYFPYGETEVAYLKKKDKKLAAVINRIGHVNRPVSEDLFETVVQSIVGQQISTKAHATIRARMEAGIGPLSPGAILALTPGELQAYGLTFRKTDYIRGFAEKVQNGTFNPELLRQMPDDEAIRVLSSLNGIGVWTAEMILLHCLKRPDVLSFGDLAILRGMRMVYRHKEIDRERFEKYRKRFHPYGSVASIYFWAVSAGAIPELTDPAGVNKRRITNDLHK